MKDDPAKNAMRYEIKDVKDHLSPLTLLNFRIAGALADINKLIEKGWIDTTGVWNGREINRLGSCWIEYVETINRVEYHATLSIGPTIPGFGNDGKEIEVESEDAYRLKAHKGELPRMAWFRRLSIYALDEKALTFKKYKGEIPKEFLEKVEEHLECAITEKPRPLLEDLAFQIKGFGPFADWCIESDADLKLLCLDTVLDRNDKRDNLESIARLMSPIARAILTDDDPKGREFLRGISNPCCLAFIASHAAECHFPEMAAAIMEIVLDRLEMSKVERSFGFAPWLSLARMAMSMKMPQCAAMAVRNAITQYRAMEDGDDRKQESLRDFSGLFWKLRDFLKTEPDDTVGCNALIDAIESFGSPLMDDLDFRLLLRLGKCYTATVAGVGLDDAVESLCHVTKDYFDAFDEDHKKDYEKKPWLQQLPFGVKTPMGWQAFLCSRCGNAVKAIAAWPFAPLSMFDEHRPFPTQEPIEGLSFVDVWRGFLPKEVTEESAQKLMAMVSEDLVNAGHEEDLDVLEWGGYSTPMKTMQVRAPRDEKRSELMSSVVFAKSVEKDEQFPIAHFPFLSREYSKANCVVKTWVYHPWGHYQAADAEFTLADGRRFCAVMPFFASDRGCIIRGAPWKARIAGFANELYKREKPELPPPHKVTEGYLAEEHGGPVDIHFTEEVFDFFDQDTIDKHVSRAGFGIHGRVKAVRTIKAYDQDVLVVTIESSALHSEDLNNQLDVYIGAQNYDGPELQIGDTVESWGWLCLDIYKSALAPEDLFVQIEKTGFPTDPAEDGLPFGCGAPIFIREDQELEKNFVEFGKAALMGSSAVEKVSVCGCNPQLFDFLARMKDGRILKYNFSLGDKDGNPEGVVPGAERLVVHREKAAKGYKLTWFGIPK